LFLQPYLSQAYANAVEHTRTLGMLDSHSRALTWLEKGVVEVDAGRQPTYISPLARHYLDEFFPTAEARQGSLPPEVENWLKSSPAAPLVCERDIGQVTVSMLPTGDGKNGQGGSDQRLTLLIDCVLLGQSARTLEKLGLSSREADVLFWLAQGKSNPEIAIILGITAPTVKKHIEAIFRKLGVNNRTEAALQAHRFFTAK
jgi:DNA-binding CsgD family transcriptional regulator